MAAHDTKVGIIVRDDLLTWQKLNVTAFLASGIAASVPEQIGKPYIDGNDREYLPLIIQPIFVYTASQEHLVRTRDRAVSRGVVMAIYAEGMFKTSNDEDNRAVVRALTDENGAIVGLGLRADSKTFDKIVNGLKLHS